MVENYEVTRMEMLLDLSMSSKFLYYGAYDKSDGKYLISNEPNVPDEIKILLLKVVSFTLDDTSFWKKFHRYPYTLVRDGIHLFNSIRNKLNEVSIAYSSIYSDDASTLTIELFKSMTAILRMNRSHLIYLDNVGIDLVNDIAQVCQNVLKSNPNEIPSINEEVAKDNTMMIGDLVINFDKSEVLIGGVNIELTMTEFRIVSLLARNSGTVVTYQNIHNQVWGPGLMGTNKTLRVVMANIRKKISTATSNDYISTEMGIGYRMVSQKDWLCIYGNSVEVRQGY